MKIGDRASTIFDLSKFTLGLGFGGGLLIRDVATGTIHKRDVFGVLCFINLLHSIFEDTAVVMLLGPSLLVVLAMRTIFAIIAALVVMMLATKLPEAIWDSQLVNRNIPEPSQMAEQQDAHFMAQKIDMKITNPKICVKDSPLHGQGVFALSDIPKGEIFERCPYIVIDDDDLSEATRLQDYIYTSPDCRDRLFMCDGFRCCIIILMRQTQNGALMKKISALLRSVQNRIFTQAKKFCMIMDRITGPHAKMKIRLAIYLPAMSKSL